MGAIDKQIDSIAMRQAREDVLKTVNDMYAAVPTQLRDAMRSLRLVNPRYIEGGNMPRELRFLEALQDGSISHWMIETVTPSYADIVAQTIVANSINKKKGSNK